EFRPAGGKARIALAGEVAAKPGNSGDKAEGEGKLQESEDRRAGRVEVETQRLVDRHFQRGRGRPAAEGEHDGEGGGAEHEDETGDAGKAGAQGRPFDPAPLMDRAHAKLAGEAP